MTVAVTTEPRAAQVGEPVHPRAPRAFSRREQLQFVYLPFGIVAALVWSHTPDDAFITLRYAANLLAGNGLVYNVGDHVQGFSSPLHLLLSTVVVGTVPHGVALLAAKLLSLGVGVLAVREGSLLVQEQPLSRWAQRLACLMIATSFVMVISSLNGLETSLEAWLVVMLVRRLMASSGAPAVLAGLAFLLVATRPDALLIVLALALGAVYLGPPGARLQRGVWAVGGLLAEVLALVASRVYFHDWLPNTFWAKNGEVATSIREGARYLVRSLQAGAAPDLLVGDPRTCLALIQVLLFACGAWVCVRARTPLVYPVVAVLAQVVFVLKSSGDWMEGGRFLAPVLIPWVLVVVSGLVFVAHHVAAHSKERGTAVAVGLSVLLVVGAATSLLTVLNPAWEARGLDNGSLIAADDHEFYGAYWAALPAIVECVPRGSTIAATELGYLGFTRPDLEIVDPQGLTDRVIAHQAPRALKQSFGVSSATWWDQDSVIGRRLIATSPEVVVALLSSPARTDALGGRYVLTSSTRLTGGAAVGLYVRRDAPGRCGADA